MTREEQRNIAAEEYTKQWYKEGLDISSEDYPTDARITIADFTKGAEWADAHPYWHKADEELPEKSKLDPNNSIRVLALDEDGEYHIAIYDYSINDWQMVEGNEGAEYFFRTVLLTIDIVYWMPLPNKPEE